MADERLSPKRRAEYERYASRVPWTTDQRYGADAAASLLAELRAVEAENRTLREGLDAADGALRGSLRRWGDADRIGEEAAARWEAGYVNPHDSKAWVGKLRSMAYLEKRAIGAALEKIDAVRAGGGADA